VDLGYGSSYASYKWAGGVLCVRSDLCDEGTFWDGKNCAVSPCAEDSCTMEHSNGTCIPKSSSKFECGCADGYRWNDSSTSCVKDQCLDGSLKNKCASMRGSDGVCTRVGETDFTCGCTEGYFWSISSCRKKAALGSICTGLNKCYDYDGEITCPEEGEDFYGQDAIYAAKGACTPKSFRNAEIDGDAVVTDNNTGLMWQKYASAETYSFNNAIGYCADLEYAGYTDWRLPNQLELISILDFGEHAPINTDYFPGVDPYYDEIQGLTTAYSMWGSASYQISKEQAFNVYLRTGFNPLAGYDLKTRKSKVRCVRGDAMKNSLTTWTAENGEEVLVETESGLMLNPDTTSDGAMWGEKLDSCENYDYAGYTDWRAANLYEAFAFAGFPSMSFWVGTSTRNILYSPEVFVADSSFNNYRSNADDYFNVMCVRSGNVPADFQIDGEAFNMTCGEIFECINNKCLDGNSTCTENCISRSTKNAQYQYQDFNQCYQNHDECNESENSGRCRLAACTAELEACFANSGEGPHCMSNYDLCYSSEEVEINKTCLDMTQCMDSCGEDRGCLLACEYYSTDEATGNYHNMNYYLENECAGAADLEGCMLYYNPSIYVNCYGIIDSSCSILSDCMNSCNDQACKDRCRSNATEVGNTRYDALQQCRSDNSCGDGDPKNDDCTWSNCEFERAACYNGQTITCGEFTACMNKCADDDDSCKQACRERVISSEVETQYNDLQECYSDFEESCNKESDPFGCLLDSCRTQYLMCFGYLYSGGFNDTCSDVEACILSCSANYSDKCQQGCYANADPEAVTLFNNKYQCYSNYGCMDYYYYGNTQSYFDCINTYCQNEYNACTASSSDFNTSCEEILLCQDSCGSDSNCYTACQTNATLDASADFYNLAICDNNCINSGYYTVCIKTNCSSEYAACGIDVSNFDSPEMDCGDLSTCVYRCDSDSSCIQICYDNASLDGATQYDDLNQCVANNNDSCQNEENPSDCLIAACQTEYNTCYGGGGSSSGGSCDEYTATDISCMQIFTECASACSYDYNRCIQKGAPEAQTLAQNYLNCAYDCASTSDYEACYSANCLDEEQACING